MDFIIYCYILSSVDLKSEKYVVRQPAPELRARILMQRLQDEGREKDKEAFEKRERKYGFEIG